MQKDLREFLQAHKDCPICAKWLPNGNPATAPTARAFNIRWAHDHEYEAQLIKRAISRTELTPIGEQYVVPGCEKHIRPAGSQLKLWEG